MGEAMRSVRVRTGGAVLSSILIQFFAGGALGAHSAYDHAVLIDPVCTIDGEAKCWSPAEVDDALTRIFCDGGSPGKACSLPEPLPFRAITKVPEPAQPVVAIQPDNPKLDASGVPEFNAFEEGCDD